MRDDSASLSNFDSWLLYLTVFLGLLILGFNIFDYAVKLLFLNLQCLISNPSLRSNFFGKPIYPDISHVRANNPLGHFSLFNAKVVDKLTSVAKSDVNGMVTLWMGCIPVLYVTNNTTRCNLINEYKVGVVNDREADIIKFLNGNNVMINFPGFMSNQSGRYKQQRSFLTRHYHQNVDHYLPSIKINTAAFLDGYVEQGKSTKSLREFITLLVLYNSSHLLGLTEYTLDNLYHNSVYRDAIDRVAHYGVSKREDSVFENTLYDLFLEILSKNFSVIFPAEERGEQTDGNLIQNIFFSRDIPFPKSFSDFTDLPKECQHNIAMNFMATGIGAMVHSTVNSLDWAIARLLKNTAKLDELTKLMADARNEGLDLTDSTLYDKKGGVLFPLMAWVMHNVFLFPTFSHEFFRSPSIHEAKLPSGLSITVPSGGYIVVNYRACNQSVCDGDDLQKFSTWLDDQSTVLKFAMNRSNASFGGSGFGYGRRCPGAQITLMEQAIIIGILLNYDLAAENVEEISCDIDTAKFPLCSRVNEGGVLINTRYESSPLPC